MLRQRIFRGAANAKTDSDSAHHAGISLRQISFGSDLITFDDLPTPGPSGSLIPNGYGGLDWSNFYYLNGTTYQYQPNGYNNGIVSPHNVALNGYGSTAMNSASGGTFEFNSAYFTGAWNDGLQMTVQGYDNSMLLDSVTFTINTSGPTLETFDWTGVNELVFSSIGGTHNPSFGKPALSSQWITLSIRRPSRDRSCLVLGAIGLLGFRWLLSRRAFGL